MGVKWRQLYLKNNEMWKKKVSEHGLLEKPVFPPESVPDSVFKMLSLLPFIFQI